MEFDKFITKYNFLDIQMKILVNNAGVMMFGEFHWLTEEMISEQINVNLLGPMRVTKTFMSLLRINQGNFIHELKLIK